MTTKNTTENPDVWLFTHLVEHARAQRGEFAPTVGIAQCWDYPLFEVPDWAMDAAANNDPPPTWCPHLGARAPRPEPCATP